MYRLGDVFGVSLPRRVRCFFSYFTAAAKTASSAEPRVPVRLTDSNRPRLGCRLSEDWFGWIDLGACRA
jgi:hypothetical protein